MLAPLRAAIRADAAHSQALLRDSLRSALRAEPVDLQILHAIVTLALPGCPVRAHYRAGCRAAPLVCRDSAPRRRIKIASHATRPQASAAKLTRALDALLLRSGAAAAPAAVVAREENDAAAAAAAGSLSLLPLPPLHVGPCRAASPPLGSPTSAAQQRACASRRVAADEALPVWSRAPPAACAADVTLIARFHADAAAVAALPPGAAAAVVAALLCEAVDDITDDVTDAGPVCGIMLSPLLDARGRLLRGTCALVHADAAGGPPRAHLYRTDALQTWLARPAPPTHPATRAPVARQHVFWLR